MLNLMLHDRVKGLFLRIEDSGRATMLCDVKASNLTDRPFRCQVALENNQWARGVERVIHWSDYLLSLVKIRRLSQILCHRLARHS